MSIKGTAGDDTIIGTSGNDVFDLSQGGNDTVQGLGGDDIFAFGATFTAADSIDGGAGTDVLKLNGDYSAGVVLAASSMTSVESIWLVAGHSYTLTTNDANVDAGTTLIVSAAHLGAGDSLNFDGAAETDGHFRLVGGAGNDTLIGGDGADIFNLARGGSDTVEGGGGNDLIRMGDTFDPSDVIDGGAGYDRVELTTDSDTVVGPTAMQNVEKVVLSLVNDRTYNMTIANSDLAAGQTLVVDGSALTIGDLMHIDASAVTEGHLTLIGSTNGDGIFFKFGGNFGPMDSIVDANVVELDGDYSAGLTITPHMLQGSVSLDLLGDHGYNLTLDDLPALPAIYIFTGNGAFSLPDPGAASLTFDGSKDTHSFLSISGTPGNDVLIGNGVGDYFYPEAGTDVVEGGGGGDVIVVDASTINPDDRLDGGGGGDSLFLDGGTSGTNTYDFAPDTISNIGRLYLQGSTPFDITTSDANVAAGQTLTLDCSAVPADDPVAFDGSAETDGHFDFIVFSAAEDLTGGALTDTFDYTKDTLVARQEIGNFDFANDIIAFKHVRGDPALNTGSLSNASFTTDLTAALAGHLDPHHAILFTPNAGDLAGSLFLIIDGNGVAGYQAARDLVIQLVNPRDVSDFDAGDWSQH
jgi:RTX calcium-binding nonapeptide repeat (4 copies)